MTSNFLVLSRFGKTNIYSANCFRKDRCLERHFNKDLKNYSKFIHALILKLVVSILLFCDADSICIFGIQILAEMEDQIALGHLFGQTDFCRANCVRTDRCSERYSNKEENYQNFIFVSILKLVVLIFLVCSTDSIRIFGIQILTEMEDQIALGPLFGQTDFCRANCVWTDRCLERHSNKEKNYQILSLLQF